MKLKRIMAMVLCFAMVLSTMSFSVFAADDYVAYIGEQGYETLQLALDAAKDETNIEINLVADATLDINAWDTLAIGGENTESITINGNNHTLTFNHLNSDWNNVVTKNGAKLILNDMAITNSGHNNGPWNRHDINFACDVEMNKVTSDKALAFKASAVLDTVTITDANTSDTYAIWIQSNGQTVTITNSTIDMLDCTDGRGIKIANEYVKDTEEKVTLTVTGTSFKTEEKAAILVCSTKGADINLSEVDINGVAADTVNAVWNDEDTADYLDNITVTGGTVKQEGAASVAYVAQIEGGDYFASLADAVVAAKSGDIITILQSGDYEMPEFKDKELTFIGMDKENTTINDWVEKNSQGMSGSTVNFKDLTINGQTNNYYGLFHTNGVTYENCNINGLRFLYSPTTYTGCVFNAEGVEHSFWTYGANEVIVTNCTFNYTDRAVNCYSDQANQSTEITFDNCTFNYKGAEDTPEGAVEINSSRMTSMNVVFENDCAAPTKGEMWFNSRWDSQNGANTTVTVDDTQVWPVTVEVAQIGDKKYTSLQAAINAAQTDDVITIISDIVMTTENYVTNSGGYAAMVNVADKSVTIDLNGKPIKVEARANDLANVKDSMLMAVFAVDTNGTLTLKDNIGTGSVDVTANDANVYSLAVAYGEGSKLNIESGSYTADKVSSALIYSQYDEVVTVSGGNFYLGNVGTESNGSPWIFNASGQNTKNVIVIGGTFNADVFHQYYIFEVKDTTEVAELLNVPVKAAKDNGDGTWTIVDAVAYVNEQHKSGKWYTQNTGYASLAEAIEAAGKYTHDDLGYTVTLAKDLELNNNVVIGEGISLNCGDYSVVLASETATLTAPEGLNVTTNVERGKVEYVDGVYKVVITNYVEWVQAELFAGNDVTLDRDIVISDYNLVHAHAWPSNGDGMYNEVHGNGAIFHIIKPGVVLDLNGHSITWNAHDDDYCDKRQVSLFMVTATGNAGETSDFTVKDSVGTGKVDVYGMASGMYVVLTTAKATIEGGTWTNYPCNICEASNIFMYPTHGGTLEITGGTFEQKDSEYLLGWKGSTQETTDNGVGVDYDQTKVVISGGTFVGFNPENVKFFDTANSGQETINGCAEGYNVTYDSFKKLYTVTKGWTISAEAEYGEVKAGESVLVTIKASGENFTAADWKLNYEADKFDFAGIVTDIDDKDLHKADKSYVSGVVMNADSQDAYNNNTVLAVYKFTAKKLTEEVKGEFTLTDASVGTVAMASSSYPAATPINDEVKILLNDFIVSVKYKAEDVVNNKVIIPYDGNAHKIDITTEPEAKVWYSTDEGQTWVEDVPEFSEYGEHKLTYKVDVPDGYDQTAKNPVTIIVNIIEPDKFVEVVEYVSEYKLVLVYTKVDNAYFTYGDRETLMLDVTAAGYQYTDDAGNTSDETYKVYGYVVPREMVDEETAQNDDFYKNKVKFVANATGKPAAVNPYDYNVNCDPSAETIANLADVVYTSGVFNAQDKSMEESYMKAILKADVCREATSLKCVDNDDITAVKNNYTENR